MNESIFMETVRVRHVVFGWFNCNRHGMVLAVALPLFVLVSCVVVPIPTQSVRAPRLSRVERGAERDTPRSPLTVAVRAACRRHAGLGGRVIPRLTLPSRRGSICHIPATATRPALEYTPPCPMAPTPWYRHRREAGLGRAPIAPAPTMALDGSVPPQCQAPTLPGQDCTRLHCPLQI